MSEYPKHEVLQKYVNYHEIVFVKPSRAVILLVEIKYNDSVALFAYSVQ